MFKPLPLLATALLLISSSGLKAADLTVIYSKLEQKHFVTMLESALEHTKNEGAFQLKLSETSFGAARAIDEIADNTGNLHILTRGSNMDDEKKLLPIRVPLDKGLLGYRIMLIRQPDLPKFAAIQSIDEIKKLRIGQGSRWPDTKILDAAGFTVTKAYYQAGLLRMLHEERFDMLARATWEVPVGLADASKQGINGLAIEPSLAIYYPQPRIFMVSRKGDGPALAARIERGLRAMIKDGTFDRIFSQAFGPALEAARLHERKIFRVDNKFLSPETPFDDKSLWLDASAPYSVNNKKP